MRPPDKGGRLGRGRSGHIFGVLPKGAIRGEMYGAKVPSGGARIGKTTRTLHVSPLQIQGGGGTRGDGAAALM